MRRYTQEERDFFVDFVPGHSYREILEEFNRRFHPAIKQSQVKGYIANNKLNTGRTGQFRPGHVPQNKGKKVSPEAYEKSKPTMFKKGNVPANRVPLGTEMLRDDGYIWVKIQDGHGNKNWIQKHRYLWEQANGAIPQGKILIFADGDRTNMDLRNLRVIDKKQNVRINQMGLSGQGPEAVDTVMLMADVKSKIGEARRRK